MRLTYVSLALSLLAGPTWSAALLNGTITASYLFPDGETTIKLSGQGVYVYLDSINEFAARSVVECASCSLSFSSTPQLIGGANIGQLWSNSFAVSLLNGGDGVLTGKLWLYADDATVLASTDITTAISNDTVSKNLPFFESRSIECSDAIATAGGAPLVASPEPSTLLLVAVAALGLKSRARS